MENVESFIDYLESLKLYRQARVNRWQLRDYVFAENDAEHQLLVAQIIVILNKVFNVPDSIALKALSYGCCHDYPESTEDSFGDVNHMLKEKNPMLKKLVKEQEAKSMQNVPEFYCAMQSCANDDTAELIIGLADAMDALLYCRREIRHNTLKDEWIDLEKEVSVRLINNWNILSELSEKGYN